MLKAHYCIPPLDRAYSALLEDLHQRGLLDETLVVTIGEFGRTPRINHTKAANTGARATRPCYRRRHPRRPGLWRQRRTGALPTDNPVSPEDLLATIYDAIGVDPHAEIHDRESRPIRICDGRPVMPLFG